MIINDKLGLLLCLVVIGVILLAAFFASNSIWQIIDDVNPYSELKSVKE